MLSETVNMRAAVSVSDYSCVCLRESILGFAVAF